MSKNTGNRMGAYSIGVRVNNAPLAQEKENERASSIFMPSDPLAWAEEIKECEGLDIIISVSDTPPYAMMTIGPLLATSEDSATNLRFYIHRDSIKSLMLAMQVAMAQIGED